MLKASIVTLTITLFSLSSGQTLAACLSKLSADADFPESVVSASSAVGIQDAWYDDATGRYAHGVLGDAIEPSTLVVNDSNGCAVSIELDETHVFEDLAPRLADIDGQAGAEVITVRSHREYGAQIAIYQLADGALTLSANTPYIGTSYRWLSPVGIADFNNDGDMDIAYVDRPHLAKILRVWSYRNGKLEQIANKAGYSNHRIGEAFITGGLKTCDQEIAMITADGRWNRIMETTLKGNQLISKDVGTFNGAESVRQALLCE